MCFNLGLDWDKANKAEQLQAEQLQATREHDGAQPPKEVVPNKWWEAKVIPLKV
eukprot:m.36203 g.36203  ORF g.36203 m.36203 type:complete len:54 (-) comp5373_c0_seq1:976-1137(-)